MLIFKLLLFASAVSVGAQVYSEGTFDALPGFWCVDTQGTTCIRWDISGPDVSITIRGWAPYGYTGFEIWNGTHQQYPGFVYTGYVTDGTRVIPHAGVLPRGTPVKAFIYANLSVGASPVLYPQDQSHFRSSVTTDGENFTTFVVNRTIAGDPNNPHVVSLVGPRVLDVFTCFNPTNTSTGDNNYFFNSPFCYNPAWGAEFNGTGSYNPVEVMADFSQPFESFKATVGALAGSYGGSGPPAPPTGNGWCAPNQQFCTLWKVVGSTVEITVRAWLRDSTGSVMWVAVGFAKNPQAMVNADAYIMWIDAADSVTTRLLSVRTYNPTGASGGNIVVQNPAENGLDIPAPATLVSSLVADGYQEFVFTRSVEGLPMSGPNVNLIWATGSRPTVKNPDGTWVIQAHTQNCLPTQAPVQQADCGYATMEFAMLSASVTASISSGSTSGGSDNNKSVKTTLSVLLAIFGSLFLGLVIYLISMRIIKRKPTHNVGVKMEL